MGSECQYDCVHGNEYPLFSSICVCDPCYDDFACNVECNNVGTCVAGNGLANSTNVSTQSNNNKKYLYMFIKILYRNINRQFNVLGNNVRIWSTKIAMLVHKVVDFLCLNSHCSFLRPAIVNLDTKETSVNNLIVQVSS